MIALLGGPTFLSRTENLRGMNDEHGAPLHSACACLQRRLRELGEPRGRKWRRTVQQNLCAFQMQYYCSRFFYSVFVVRCRVCRMCFFVSIEDDLVSFCSGILRAWLFHSTENLDTFLIFSRRIVSFMCKKCLLYSFKKFELNRQLYINLSISTCSEGVLFVAGFPILTQRFDSALSAVKKAGRRQSGLHRCKTSLLMVWHHFTSCFLPLDIDKYVHQ